MIIFPRKTDFGQIYRNFSPMKEHIHAQIQSATEPGQVRQMLREMEKAHPELAVHRQLEEIQGLALQVLVQGQSPAALKKGLKKLSPQPDPLATALARLTSLLSRLETKKELCLNAAGQLQAPPASLTGPLYIDALEQISAAARDLWPEVPSPGEAVGWLWPVKPKPVAGPSLDLLRQELDRLSQLDMLVESTDRKIKLIDRINIFTDSPEEAALKQHKAERKAAEVSWKEARGAYHQEAASWHGSQEATFVSDRLVSLIEALAKVSTTKGRKRSFINCPLNNADSLLPDCNWLMEKQSHRHGYSGDYESLTRQVCAAQPGQASLPERLKEQLGNALNAAVKAAQLAESEYQEAVKFTAHAQKKVTLMDKINIFTDSPREVAAKEAKRVECDLARGVQWAQEEIRKVLMGGLESFPSANLYYMCEELRARCTAIQVLCCSENVTRGSGDDEYTVTEYWCEIVGLEEARRQASRCAATCHQHHGQVHGLYRQLTRQRMHEVQEPSLADVIRRSFS